MRISLSLLLAVAVGSTVAAEVYKIVGPDGRVIYSDRPAPGAEQIDVGPVQTYAPPPLPAGSRDADQGKSPAFQGYDAFEITAPDNDAAVRDNAGNVAIDLSIEPALRPGHSIGIFMDGKDVGGEGRSTSLALTNVDRGTHTVYAVVRDDKGEELARTPAVTFHLKRASAATP